MNLDDLAPPPRLVDGGILVSVVLAAASGVVGLVTGTPSGAWIFVVHGLAGVALVPLLAWKFARVYRRVTGRWNRAIAVSALLATIALATIATGIYWVHGGLVRVLGGFWTLMNVHIGLGILTSAVLVWHLRYRFRTPTREDVTDRRAALQFGGTLVAGALLWRLQGVANATFDLAGANRRFTGSKEDGTDSGNAFPVTSWVADDPQPVDPDEWSLQVRGRVERDLSIGVDDLPGNGDTADAPNGGGIRNAVPFAERRALLDCTSGWYSVHDWQGIRVGDLLAAVDPGEDARYVRFLSVTGYRWTLPIEEARDAVLATHVDGDRLSHGHGYPLRLVAPGRRGFQWVKWVTAVEVRQHDDPGQWIATLISGFD
jgi:DMSO/TMAO reductase YedYZ molybdopterin-dependent catalytic subunit